MTPSEANARKIPDVIRSMKLMTPADPIHNAVNSENDPNMQLLYAIWFEFVQPHAEDKNIGCWRCRGAVLDSFQRMKPFLLELEKQSELLNSLKV